MRRFSCARGYTLIEAMLVVAIVATVASLGAAAFKKTIDFYLGASARSEIQRDARTSLDLIDNFLRQAQSSTVCIDSPGGACSCMSGVSSTGGYWSRVCFSTIDGRKIRFYQNGAKLMVASQAPGAANYDTTMLSGNLAYLAFAFSNTQNTTLMDVSLTTQKQIQLGLKKALALSIQKVRIMN